MKYLLTLILLMTTNMFSMKILDTEVFNEDWWKNDAGNSPMINMIDGHRQLGIVVVCIAGSVYVRQINHGEFTPLKYRFTAQGSSASLSYGCDQYMKNYEKALKQQEKQNKKNK